MNEHEFIDDLTAPLVQEPRLEMVSSAPPQSEEISLALADIRARVGDVSAFNLAEAPVSQVGAIAPFFAPGDYGLLVAAASSGKSIMLLDLIASALLPDLDGGAWGGALKVNMDWMAEGRVALIDAEDTKLRWLARFRKYLESRRPVPEGAIEIIADRLLYLDPQQLGLGEKGERAQAYCYAAGLYLRSRGVRLVCGDTQAAIFNPDDIRSDAWVYQTVVPFQKSLKEAGICTMMAAHHARPSDGNSSPKNPLGTSQQENQADVVLKAARTDHKLKVEVRKSRRAEWIMPGAAIEATLPETGFGYFLDSDAEAEWPKEQPEILDPAEEHRLNVLDSLTEKQQRGLEVIKESGEESVTDKEIEAHVGCDRATPKKIGDKLVKLGIVVQVPGDGAKEPRRWKAVKQLPEKE